MITTCAMITALVPIPFFTGDSDLDCELHIMVIEAQAREDNPSDCYLPGYRISLAPKDYPLIPRRKKPTPPNEMIRT